MTDTPKPDVKTKVAVKKQYLVSRRADSVTIQYDGDVIMLDSRGKVLIDPSKLDQKELPTGVTLV